MARADRIEAVLEGSALARGRAARAAAAPRGAPGTGAGARRPPRPRSPSRSTRRRPRTSTTRSASGRKADGLRAWVHIADVSRYRAGRLPAGSGRRRAWRSRSTCPAESSRCCPSASRPTSAACGRTRTAVASPSRSCSTADLVPGEPAFYRSLIRSRERLTYSRAEAILAGRERDRRRADGGAPSRRAARDRSSGAGGSRAGRCGSRPGRSSSPSTGRAESSGPGCSASLHAHALVEELMILANEAVARPARRSPTRGPLPRPRAARAAVDRAPAREARGARGADAARSGAAEPGRGRAARGAGQRARRPSTPRSRDAGRTPFRRSSCARSSRRATTRATSATPVSPARRTATSPRRSAATRTSSSTDRCCASSGSPTSPSRRSSSELADWTSAARAPGRPGRVPRRRDLPRLAARAAALPCRVGRSPRRRDRRRDRLGSLRSLRRGLRGLPARAPLAGRLLRARPARSLARRATLGAAHTAWETKSPSASSGSKRRADGSASSSRRTIEEKCALCGIEFLRPTCEDGPVRS